MKIAYLYENGKKIQLDIRGKISQLYDILEVITDADGLVHCTSGSAITRKVKPFFVTFVTKTEDLYYLYGHKFTFEAWSILKDKDKQTIENFVAQDSLF